MPTVSKAHSLLLAPRRAPKQQADIAAQDAPGRVVGVDLGDRRIGIALSDPRRTLASPLTVIQRSPKLHAEIGRLVDEWQATTVVVGLPLSLDGSVGPAAEKALAEVEKLGATLSVPVETYDERLTTVTAERMMTDAGLDSRRQRKVVDKIAAAVMLQAWLDHNQHATSLTPQPLTSDD